MIRCDIESFLVNNQFRKKSYKELSLNDRNGTSLVDSEIESAYDFDEITGWLFSKNPPTSADAILFRPKDIYLIEFKTGFNRKISLESFDESQCLCEKTQTPCKQYAKLMKQDLKNIERELSANLKLKAVESGWTLRFHIVPECSRFAEEDKSLRLNYVIVTDMVRENPVDAMEAMMGELSRKSTPSNYFVKMERQLKRFWQENRFRTPSFYHKVQVMSVQEFDKYFTGRICS